MSIDYPVGSLLLNAIFNKISFLRYVFAHYGQQLNLVQFSVFSCHQPPSPDDALLLRVHGRAERTAPVLRKLSHVGEGTIHPEPGEDQLN